MRNLWWLIVPIISAVIIACILTGFYFLKFHCISGIHGSSWEICSPLVSLFSPKFFADLSSEKGDWGTFGDFVGGTLNPILSFLSLIVLLLTYAMQRKELEKTEETQKRQQFENMFFELLKIHNQELEIFCKTGAEEVFDWIRQSEHFGKKIDLSKANSILKGRDHFSGQYFRVLYQLLKFIAVHSDNRITETFEIPDIERNDVSKTERMYSNIVRALLPDKIMQLLAVNCYSKENDSDNYWKYKLLIERYDLFEHTSFNITKNYGYHVCLKDAIKEIQEFYKDAFGKKSQ